MQFGQQFPNAGLGLLAINPAHRAKIDSRDASADFSSPLCVEVQHLVAIKMPTGQKAVGNHDTLVHVELEPAKADSVTAVNAGGATCRPRARAAVQWPTSADSRFESALFIAMWPRTRSWPVGSC